MHSLGCPPGFRPSPPFIVASITRLGNSSLCLPRRAPRKEEPALHTVDNNGISVQNIFTYFFYMANCTAYSILFLLNSRIL